MKDNKSGWQFPKALEIIKCKEGNKEFMKERPARRPFGNTVLICEYPIDDTAAEEPNAKLITWRLAKRAARDFLRVSFMPSECDSCGWEAAEAARRREYVKEHGLTLCADGFRRLIIRKEKDMATPYKECPHCGAHLDSGEKCECRAEEIETVHSQKCACGLTEQDVESGWECPLDNPNETVERCEDCAFAKETD